MRISDWSSDVCSSDLKTKFLRKELVGLGRLKSHHGTGGKVEIVQTPGLPIYISGLGSKREITDVVVRDQRYTIAFLVVVGKALRVVIRSEEHTSELQSLMRISYAVFCLKKKIHE